MAETKPKNAPSLRTPGPKKKLGLAVPPALRMPHDDFITPRRETPIDSETKESKEVMPPTATMPSQTSLTRHSSLPSQTSHTSKTDDNSATIAPQKDFTKVANSIGRQAVPSGLFTGKSKQLYDCLYTMTRGAIVPTRSVRISRPKLMAKAHIGSRVTFDANIERLAAVGLISIRQIAGEHEGNEYTVKLPEELKTSMPSQTSQTRLTSLTGSAQKLDRLVSLETSQTRHTLSSDSATSYDTSKTSFNTIETIDDDEAFAGLNETLRQAAKELTGKEPSRHDNDRWQELAEVLVTELKIAAARTTVSSVPSFLAEHLRRRLWKKDKQQMSEEGKSSTGEKTLLISSTESRNCPDCGGTNFFYPKGFEGGVTRCRHERLKGDEPSSPVQQKS
jgi:hypothetical protein